LDCDDDGWIKVHDTLQSTSHDFLFAAGDCAAVKLSADCNIPKAGLYAVRAGPVLIENLTRYLESIHSPSTALSSSTSSPSITRQLPVVLHPYIPQVDFLKLLVCGDGTALGFRFGLVLRGKWVFDLKDNIDRSFMNLFDVSALPNPPPSVEDGHQLQQSGYDTRQYDSSESETTLDDVQRLLSRPDEAAILLQRIDDGVDFRQAKAVLRAMGSDVVFRQAVLQHVRDTKTEMAVLQT
jgi:hypothetical protein